MKTIIFLFAILLCSIRLFAQQSIDIQKIEHYWQEEKYSKVIEEIDKYYTSNKRTLKLDIYKVASLCSEGVNKPDPKQMLAWIKNAYYPTPKLIDDINDCRNLNIKSVSQYCMSNLQANNRPKSKWKAKGGYSTQQSTLENDGDSLNIVKYIPDDYLQKRRLSKNSKTDKVLFHRRLYDSLGLTNYNLKIIDKFIIVYASTISNLINFNNLEKKLNFYFDFYTTEYSLKQPDDFITIFLAKDITELKQLSEKLHGFIVPSYNLGYSSLEDQSIVSIYNPMLGTVCHELFHILSKCNYPALPAWLEEGMASLYEVSILKENKVFGVNNWRINFFSGGHYREEFDQNEINQNLISKNVIDIINLDWETFNKSDEYESNQSFNYAFSRYLMLYLQDRGNLTEFFKEAANYSYMDIKKNPSDDYLGLLIKYSTPTKDFDQDFKDWIKTMIKQWNKN